MRLFLAVTLVLLTTSAALAQTGAALMLKPWPAEQFVEATGSATFVESGHLRKLDADYDIDTYEAVGRVRIFPGQLVSPRLGFEYVRHDVDSPLLPDQLVDVSVAGGAFVGKWREWVFGLTLGAGYAGEAPFGDGNAWYAKSDIGVGREIDETTRVGFVLNYDGNRTFMPDVPLPGFAYNKQLDPTVIATLGFPINAVTWKPNDRLEVDLTLFIPDNVDVSVRYKLTDYLGVFASLAGRRHAFVLEGLDKHDRLIYFQRRAEVGLRLLPNAHVNAVVAGGYAFGQQYETGWDTRDADKLFEPSDEPYVRVGVDVNW